jgi:SAM-dependent methyltransferase
MNCRACRSDRLDEVFSMDPMPLAGAFAATAEDARAMPKYPLTWLLCHDCGLVNVAPDIPDELIYSTYSYAASTVPALVRHHAGFAKVLTGRYDKRGVTLLDIGCNDGVLLNQLPGDLWALVGFDPSDVAAKANPDTWFPSQDWTLVNESFGADVSAQWDGYFDVVTSSNAFAHFSDIAGALDGVARVLRPGGDFWIEVHDLDATIDSGQWDTIYHEHKVEWSIISLLSNLLRVGLDPIDSWSLPLHGGLLRVLARKQTPRVAIKPLGYDFTELRASYNERGLLLLPERSWAYGAAARATVYLNQAGTEVEAVVDGSVLRAGKFVPGLGTRVVTPWEFDHANPPATLITAWNHADDIKAKHPGYTNWVTAW